MVGKRRHQGTARQRNRISTKRRSIYRISRNPGNRQVVPRGRNTSGKEEVVRFYPISHKTLENRQQNLASLIDELSTSTDIHSTRLTAQSSSTTASTVTPREKSPSRTNATSSSKVSRQKVIDRCQCDIHRGSYSL